MSDAPLPADFRPPANAILGFVDLLLDSSLTPEQRDHLETIRASAQEILRKAEFVPAPVPVPTPIAAIPAPAPEGKPPASSLRILVVEDNLVNQRLLLALLERYNHGRQVEVAHHGGEALEHLRRAPFDLIFMDVQMPVMDGFECTRRIRQGEGGAGHRAIPIIAVTAGAMRGDREKCLEAGMDDYISKPISSSSLKALLEQVARGREG